MDVDPEIEPLLLKTRETLERLRTQLLPLLSELDEDILVSHYSLGEQARLYLAAAFTLAFSLYSLDKLTHRKHAVVQLSGSGKGGYASPDGHADSAAKDSAPHAGNIDAQLLLKIERITDYIKKLREITDLAQRQQQQLVKREQETEGGKDAPECAAEGVAGTRKRGRDEEAEGQGTRTGDGDMGDTALFSVVTRVPGETGVMVSRLLRHVTGGSIDEEKA